LKYLLVNAITETDTAQISIRRYLKRIIRRLKFHPIVQFLARENSFVKFSLSMQLIVTAFAQTNFHSRETRSVGMNFERVSLSVSLSLRDIRRENNFWYPDRVENLDGGIFEVPRGSSRFDLPFPASGAECSRSISRGWVGGGHGET